MESTETCSSGPIHDRMFVFFDTNICLHFKPLNQCDWLSICKAREVVLVACGEVIHELDRHKSEPRTRERARSALKNIIEIKRGGGSVRAGVTLQVITAELRDEDIPAPYSPSSVDDRIILQAKRFAEKTAGKDAVVIYSDDGAMQLKCDERGVRAIEPCEQTRLPNLKTEEEKKRAEAEKQLQELMNRLPQITVHLRHFGNHDEQPTPRPLRLFKTELIDIVEDRKRERRAVPAMEGETHGSLDALTRVARFPTGLPSKEELQRYAKDRAEYFTALDVYYERAQQIANAVQRTFCFDVIVRNVGTSPADAVRIVIDFPPVLRKLFIGKDKFQKILSENSKPKRPTPPQSAFDMSRLASYGAGYRSDVNQTLASILRPPPIFQRHDEPSASVVEKEGRFRALLELPKLIHHHEHIFQNFVGVFDSTESAKSFQAGLVITSASLPRKKEDKLPFIVTEDSFGAVDADWHP